MTVGRRIIILYFFMTYLFPLVGNILFADNIHSIYKIHEINFLSVALIALIFGAYWFLSARVFRGRKFSVPEGLRLRFVRFGAFYRRHRLKIAIMAFVGGAFFFYKDLSSYRYSSQGILQRGSIALVVGMLIDTFVIVDLTYFMFVDRSPVLRFSRLWKENVLMALALFLVVDGTGSMFLATYCLLYSFFPGVFQRLFFVEKKQNWRQKIPGMASLVAISVLFAGISWTYGESIKNRSSAAEARAKLVEVQPVPGAECPKDSVPVSFLGLTIDVSPCKAKVAKELWEYRISRVQAKLHTVAHFLATGEWVSDSTQQVPHAVQMPTNIGGALMDKLKKFLEVFTTTDFSKFSYYLVERLSAHYYSYLHVVETPKADLAPQGESPLELPIRTFIYRVDGVTGGIFGVQRPEIASISQLNYRKLVVTEPREREGTSPGLLGSFGYVFSFPFSLLFCLLYLCFLSNMFDVLVDPGESKTIPFIGIFLLMTLFEIFFDSPFDFLQILDNGTIKFALILGLFIAHGKRSVEPVPRQG